MTSLSKANITSILQKLLPRGLAWPQAASSTLAKLLSGWALSISVMDARLRDLLAELNPATTNEMLSDWEYFVGSVDDCCSTVISSIDQRRARVLIKLNENGGNSKAYFLKLASDLGYVDTTITEFKPTHCEMHCESVLIDERWRRLWQVNLPHQGNNHTFFRADGRADERVDSYVFGALECVFMKLKPAHSFVQFTYKATP